VPHKVLLAAKCPRRHTLATVSSTSRGRIVTIFSLLRREAGERSRRARDMRLRIARADQVEVICPRCRTLHLVQADDLRTALAGVREFLVLPVLRDLD
jgi:phage FluMu protein Com